VRAVNATTRRSISGALVALAIATIDHAARADTVVQLNVDAMIDGRSVSTASGGVVTPWSAGDGLDATDGFVTTAVEQILQTQGKTTGGMIGPALPDDGAFPADMRHPTIQLHFSNAAPTTSAQTHQLGRTTGPQGFVLAVPPASYSRVFLVLTSSYGVGALTVTLSYAGADAPTVTNLSLPDWGAGGAAPNDPVFFNLVQGLHKWTSTDDEIDTPTHGITAIELDPTPDATLTSIEVEKTNAAQVVFWGATGVATSAVGADGGASDGATDAAPDIGASDAEGAESASDAGGVDDAVATEASGATGTGKDAGSTVEASGGGATDAASQSEAGGTAARPRGAAASGCALAPSRGDDGASALFIVLVALLRRRRRVSVEASDAEG
jgi:hypothetical protein